MRERRGGKQGGGGEGPPRGTMGHPPATAPSSRLPAPHSTSRRAPASRRCPPDRRARQNARARQPHPQCGCRSRTARSPPAGARTPRPEGAPMERARRGEREWGGGGSASWLPWPRSLSRSLVRVHVREPHDGAINATFGAALRSGDDAALALRGQKGGKRLEAGVGRRARRAGSSRGSARPLRHPASSPAKPGASSRERGHLCRPGPTAERLERALARAPTSGTPCGDALWSEGRRGW